MTVFYLNELWVLGDGAESMIAEIEASGWPLVYRSEKAVKFVVETINSVPRAPDCLEWTEFLVVISRSDDYGEATRSLTTWYDADWTHGHFSLFRSEVVGDRNLNFYDPDHPTSIDQNCDNIDEGAVREAMKGSLQTSLD